jgi:fumarate reductase flavoprotein subunit
MASTAGAGPHASRLAPHASRMSGSSLRRIRTDILILGSGGAGLFAALHAHRRNPALSITVAVKGLLGKSGCTRMVQGGYNVALAPGDSVERHFMDTITGGQWLPQQDLAWTLVSVAVERVHELENELGCFFDRNPDGTVHQKAFAGQTFDRTVHKGDLTGIEIINRLAEQVWASGIRRLEEHRAIEIIRSARGEAVSGVLMIDVRTGELVFVQARAVLLATGGGPTMYRYHTPSGDKSCDGMAMGLRAGLTLRDMEMVQFHPTGLIAGPQTRITGTIIEEGLRGAGGQLLNGAGERFMDGYDSRGERATRDIVSRAMFEEMRAGRVGPRGGLYITMRHLDPGRVRREFKGMVERCADCGFDLVSGLVDVVPTAHYMMGGVVFDAECRSGLPGLFVAGEDAGGVHGANRLGGNGVANSTVFGGIAGDAMAPWVGAHGAFLDPDEGALSQAVLRCRAPLARQPGDLGALRERLYEVMWNDAGIIRDAAGLARAQDALAELEAELDRTGVDGSTAAFNLAWHDWLNLENLILVSRAICCAAVAREETRGAHFRADFPRTGELADSRYTCVNWEGGRFNVDSRPVEFTRVKPGETLLSEPTGAARPKGLSG